MAPDLMKEHDYIRLIADRLRTVVAAPPNTLSPEHWRRLLDHELQNLLTSLAHHFGHEEDGGYMRDIIDRRPRTEPQFRTLFRQHAELRSTLASLIERNRCGDTPAHLSEPINDLLGRLNAHEVAETDLIQEALHTDIGGGD